MPEGTIKIDFHGWKRKDLKKFQEAATANDDDAVIALYTQVIKAWPYEGSPADVAAYDELDAPAWYEVNRQVADALKFLVSGTG